jgi:D-amino-acid dehydrogenase
VKGYSITLPLPAAPSPGAPPRPRTPVIDHALHIALTPLEDAAGTRLRVAGTAEFCGEDRRIDAARVGNLVRALAQVYPAYGALAAGPTRTDWAALRPMCADGKPLIGATRVPGLFLHTGHGQIGWTTGAASGELLAAAITGGTNRAVEAVDPRAFAPARFGL